MADTCPRCGFAEVVSDRCSQCSVVIAVYQASLDKMRRGPQGGATPFARPSAATPAPQPFPTSAPPAAFATPAPAGVRHAVFRGSGAALFGIHVINALLILVTAPEMLEASPLVIVAARLAVSILAAIFVPVAVVGARRYRLSRTSWRGIRFSLRASTREFIGVWVRGWMLTSLTLGLYYPFFVTSQQRFLTGHTWFGSQRFTFDGRGRALLGACLGTIVLFLPTLGLSWFWFAARRQRYYAEHTRFAGARFRSAVTGPKLAWLTISTWIGLLCTVGLAWPWLTVRTTRRGFAWLSLDGPLALESITQQAQQVSATGEGLAGFFDVDLGLT